MHCRDLQMAIEVDNADRAILPVDATEQRERNGMVSTECNDTR